MLLPISVTFRNLEGSKELDDAVRAEAAKLERYYSPVTSCRVMVERPQRAPSGAMHHVRIDISVPQGRLVCRHDADLHADLQDLHVPRSSTEAKAARLHTDPSRAAREAFREMRRQLQDYARKQRGDVKRRAEPLVAGRIVKLFPDSDYGFLEAPDGRQIYFHRHSVQNGHFHRLRIGTAVGFAEEQGENGPQATTIRIRHPRKQAKESARSMIAVRRSQS